MKGDIIMYFIWKCYIEELIIVCATIYLIYLVYRYFFKKRNIVSKDELILSEKHKNEKYLKKINLAIVTIFIIVICFLCLNIFDFALDFPNFINKKFETMKAISLTENDKNKGVKSIKFRNTETGKNIIIEVYSIEPIHKGECMIIKYLPHARKGFIVTRDIVCSDD